MESNEGIHGEAYETLLLSKLLWDTVEGDCGFLGDGIFCSEESGEKVYQITPRGTSVSASINKNNDIDFDELLGDGMKTHHVNEDCFITDTDLDGKNVLMCHRHNTDRFLRDVPIHIKELNDQIDDILKNGI